jgi:hypothetical protein
MNIGLTTQIVPSVLPVGLLQTWASLKHGYWYARSAELLGVAVQGAGSHPEGGGDGRHVRSAAGAEEMVPDAL